VRSQASGLDSGASVGRKVGQRVAAAAGARLSAVCIGAGVVTRRYEARLGLLDGAQQRLDVEGRGNAANDDRRAQRLHDRQRLDIRREDDVGMRPASSSPGRSATACRSRSPPASSAKADQRGLCAAQQLQRPRAVTRLEHACCSSSSAARTDARIAESSSTINTIGHSAFSLPKGVAGIQRSPFGAELMHI